MTTGCFLSWSCLPIDTVTSSTRQGDTALHWAARNGFKAVAEKLISAGAKVDASGFQGASDQFRGLPWSPEVEWKALKIIKAYQRLSKHIRKSNCFSD